MAKKNMFSSYKQLPLLKKKRTRRGSRRKDSEVVVKVKRIIHAYDTTKAGKPAVRTMPKYLRYNRLPKAVKQPVMAKYNISSELLRRYVVKYLRRPEELTLLQAAVVYDLINEVLLAHKRAITIKELSKEATKMKNKKLKGLYEL